MMSLFPVLNLIGWRGALGVAAGAALAALPAYELGVFREAAAGQERVARVLAEHQIKRMEIENGRVDAAAAARLDSLRSGDGIGMPDDGFRRD